MLSLENFKKALETVPKDRVEIVFSAFAEPFGNPLCIDMIEYSCSQGFQTLLYSTLTGLKLEDAGRLKKCTMRVFCLHLPDNLGNAHMPLTMEYKEVLTRVLSEATPDYFMSMNRQFKSNGRAGNCADAKPKHLTGWIYCWRLVRPGFVLLPNGDVTLCHMDFGLKHVLGNLFRQSFSDIENGQEYKAVRHNRFKLDGDVLCRQCSFAFPFWKAGLDKVERIVNSRFKMEQIGVE